ncbi:MAG: hypothetical protein WB563_18805 [Pseudolabrys sp.]
MNARPTIDFLTLGPNGGNPRIRFGFPLVELPLRVLPFRVARRVEFRLEALAVQASVLFPHVTRKTLASFVISAGISK